MANTNQLLFSQFGASIDMLENAIRMCPEEVWESDKTSHQFWYMAFHTLFWLDYYLSDDPANFQPPPPHTVAEFDDEGTIPEQAYSKDMLLKYLEHCREKCRAKIASLTAESMQSIFCTDSGMEFTVFELLLYNMRHVQHHAAQLNLLLRQQIDDAPNWVGRMKR